MGVDVSPQQRIEDMIRVTELCIDLLKENEEHHGEVGGRGWTEGGAWEWEPLDLKPRNLHPFLLNSCEFSLFDL